MDDNIYHRALSIPVSPDPAIIADCMSKWTDGTKRGIIPFEEDHCIDAWLRQVDLCVAFSEAFYTPPGMTLGIHTDGRDGPQSTRCKINWIYGAPGSRMVWFEPIDPDYTGIDHVTGAGTVSRIFEKHMIRKVLDIGPASPSLLNVGRPHTVVNHTPHRRWCFSYTIRDLRTGKILQWHDAVERLKEWIIDQ
jgi:hypothetical protein